MQNRAKVVVAYLDGRRIKGYVFDFSALKESFYVFPDENGHPATMHPEHGTPVQLKDLKAVFFVKDFAGNAEHRDKVPEAIQRHGRQLEVIFRDGEVQVGVTEAYNPQKPGFFMFPADLECNNERIFVINRNVSEVRVVK
ncbi:MAG TPA: hypothetical protein VGF08_07480 [Terriglobales bacterium]|jgi:hypothetical protein